MKNGSRGRDVEWMQRKLNLISPSDLPKLVEDGIFGEKSDARVKEFQNLSSLKADGIVGPNTMFKLKKAPVLDDSALPNRFNPKEPPISKIH